MCEITRNNLDEKLPEIERNIQRADFIAIDAEYTGLKLSESDKPSLFDSGDDRYRKLRKSVKQFSITQLGLAAFVCDPTKISKYHVYSYNIYLFPAAFGPIDVRYLCQASSFEFLCKHKFDFNKCIYEGVSFMNEDQESTLKQFLEKQHHIKGLDREVDERSLQEMCSQVAAWSVKAAEGDILALDSSKDVADVIIIAELKQRFKKIWAHDKDGKVLVEKVSTERRAELDLELELGEEERIMNRMLGATRVFRCLLRCRKPLVGHNCFTDLMLFYDKFYKPLPEKYSTYKADINDIFPKVIDTKHIVLNLRRPLEETSLLEYTSLGELYKSLSSERGKFYVLYSPTVSHGEGSQRYELEHCPHEAGYDAYMAGYVLLRMVHLYAVCGIKSTDVEPLSFSDYMEAVQPYVNCLNLIRATVNHVRLDDHDPRSRRPQMLYVQSRKSSDRLTLSELAGQFSPYGSVDVQLLGSTQALVAVSNHRCSREILKAFYKDPALLVVKYNHWRHSPQVRALMWAGVAVFGSVSVCTLYSGITIPH